MRSKKTIVKAALLISMMLMAIPAATEAQSVEEVVRTYFADKPVMIDIARCESKFRQFADSGSPLYGGYEGKMVGVFQIYGDIHAAYAKTLGMDIETLDGNLEYAKLLFNREGTQPWISSFPCWGKDVDAAAQAAGGGALTMNLSLGMEHPQVLVLQRLLNGKGYIVSPDGPGSPGNETQKFGAFTRVAVRKFQCAEKIACEGDEHSTGYGFVGAKTRAALEGASVAASAGTPDPTASEYTPEQQSQIAALQAQITELTKVLADLIATRGS